MCPSFCPHKIDVFTVILARTNRTNTNSSSKEVVLVRFTNETHGDNLLIVVMCSSSCKNQELNVRRGHLQESKNMRKSRFHIYNSYIFNIRIHSPQKLHLPHQQSCYPVINLPTPTWCLLLLWVGAPTVLMEAAFWFLGARW